LICNICKDTILLSRPAKEATKDDLQTALNLRDTLTAHRDECVGMAANMIGIPKAVIAILPPGIPSPLIMLNPVLIEMKGEYTAEEGCLSLSGVRSAKRFHSIKVRFQNLMLKQETMKFEGITAQIIQHELDHLKGILI